MVPANDYNRRFCKSGKATIFWKDCRFGLSILLFLLTACQTDILDQLITDKPPPTVQPIPKKTIPFTCDGAYFVRMEKGSLGHSFCIGNDTTKFYSLGHDSIRRYDFNGLRRSGVATPLNGIHAWSHAPRNNNSVWLFTTEAAASYLTKSRINSLDTAGRMTVVTDLGEGSGGYLMAGTLDHGFVLGNLGANNANPQFSFSRYSEGGQLLWKKKLFDLAVILKILPLRTGEFLLGGYSSTHTSTQGTIYGSFLAKINKDGSILWKKENHKGDLDNGFAISDLAEGPTGDYFQLITDPNRSRAIQVSKTDTTSAIKWKATIDEGRVAGSPTMALIGNELAVCYSGGSGMQDGNISDILLARIDTNGIVQWKKTYGGTGAEYPLSFFHLPPSGYVVIGRTENWDGVDRGVISSGYLIKTDLEGNSCK